MAIPEQLSGIYFSNLLAELAKRRDVDTYLEVGVQNGINLANMPCKRAVAVDPFFLIQTNICMNKQQVHLFQTTSDRFFADYPNLNLPKIEMAFLDGMHLFEYLLRDFYNTEVISTKNSLIAMHDCMPLTVGMASRSPAGAATEGPYAGFWTGDVWKVVPILKKYRPELRLTFVDCPPTGLVFVSNLDPLNTVLKDNYFEIMQEFSSLGNDEADLAEYYSNVTITASEAVLAGYDHTLFFKI